MDLPTTNARVIIADDHPTVCQGLSEIVRRMGDVEVVATAVDGDAAEHLARTLPAELLILDVAMPRRSGIKVLESLRADGITLPILFFSMYPADQYAAFVRRRGAQGFLGKEVDAGSLWHAIRRILEGGTVFPGSPPERPVRGGAPLRRPGGLSARENDVLLHLLCGMPLVEIAAELGISARSVTTYRRRILDKLGVRNNAELIAFMTRLG